MGSQDGIYWRKPSGATTRLDSTGAAGDSVRAAYIADTVKHVPAIDSARASYKSDTTVAAYRTTRVQPSLTGTVRAASGVLSATPSDTVGLAAALAGKMSTTDSLRASFKSDTTIAAYRARYSDSARVAYKSYSADVNNFVWTNAGGGGINTVGDDGSTILLPLASGVKRFVGVVEGAGYAQYNVIRTRSPLDTSWQGSDSDTLTISADTSILATQDDLRNLDSAEVADSLRQRNTTRYFKAGTGSTTSRYKAFDFSTIAGYPLLQIVSDSLSAGGLTRDIGDTYYQGGAVKILDDLSIEDETYLDEGLNFSYYDLVTDTLSVKYANTQWTKVLVVTATPYWIAQGNSIEIGTVQDNNMLRRRITSVSNDTVYVEPYLNYAYSPGTQIKLSRSRAHIYPRAASPYKPGGTLVMGFPQTTMESDSFKQTIDVAPLVRFSTPLANNYSSYVISGGTVRATSPASMTVTVDSGSALYQGKMESGQDVAQLFVAPYQTVTHAAADGSNPRIDIVCWDSVGVVKIVAGTAAASPSPPATPTRFTLLSYDTVNAGATSVTTALISDRRDGDMNIDPVGGDISFNSTAAPYVDAAGRNILTVEGSGDAGVLELAGGPTDAADNNVSHVQTIYKSYASGSQRITAITGALDGATATNRGGSIRFYTKANGSASFSEKMRVNSSGNVGIGDASPASMFTVGNGDLFQINSSGQVVKVNNVTAEGPFGVPTIIDTVEITGRTTSVSATNFTSASVAGLYRVSYYIGITTSDAGGATVLFSAIGNDGAAKTQSSATVAVASTGNAISGSFLVRITTGNVQWSTTVGGTIGSGVYRVNAICERIF